MRCDLSSNKSKQIFTDIVLTGVNLKNSLKVDMHHAVMAGCTSQMYEILIDGQNKILINILKNRKTCSVSSLLSFNILSTLFFNSFSFFSACWKNLDPLLVSRIILFIRSLSNPAFE